jgi:C-terminal processing protease CtpA/Prc
LLSKDVAYLKLSSVKMDQAAKYIESAAGTKGLIIDIRNYPSEFVVFALGSLFVDQKTDFVRPTKGDLSNPGAFYFGPPFSLEPQQPHYPGKVVILVDEITQSSAEYTAMAFRSSPRAEVIGSTTAGADGNVSAIPLPGGIRSMISGVGVFYADKKPTQRIGIIPDREVKPTIAGMRAGRDEVLEAAIREIVGKDIPAAQIEKMTEH